MTTSFNFSGREISIIGGKWVVADDLWEMLGYKRIDFMLYNVDAGRVRKFNKQTLLSELALIEVVMKCRKPEAKPIKRELLKKLKRGDLFGAPDRDKS